MKKIGIGFLSLFCCHVLASGILVPELSIQPNPAEIGEKITFEASHSQNTEGNTRNLHYRFKLSQNEDWTNFSAQSSLKKSFFETGTFTAQMEIRDKNTQTTARTAQTFRVSEVWNRRAWVIIHNPHIRAGERVTLELKQDLPPFENQAETQVRWDFEGDGEYDTDFQKTKLITHTYKGGTYTPEAEVIFPNEQRKVIHNYHQRIHVEPNFLPEPQLQISPGSQGTEKTAFLFEITNKNLSDAVWYEWAFDNEPFEKGAFYQYKNFNLPGTHTVKAKICYNPQEPICKNTSATVQVEANPINYQIQIKVQNMTQTNLSENNLFKAAPGDQIEFRAQRMNAAGTEDTFSYQWDFDGNGTYDTAFLNQNTIKHTYQALGTKNVQLRAQNQSGQIQTTTKTIQIVKANFPEINLEYSPQNPKTGEIITFTPKISGGTGRNFQVRYDVGNDGQWESRLQGVGSFQWQFQNPRQYQIKIQVVDDRQQSQSKILTLSVEEQKSPENKKNTSKSQDSEKASFANSNSNFDSNSKSNSNSNSSFDTDASLTTGTGSTSKKSEESSTNEENNTKELQAQVTVSRKHGHTRTVFEFDGSRSTGKKLKYHWEFFDNDKDKNSNASVGSAYGSKTKKKFNTPGEKTIRLTVENTQGQTDSVEFSVTVKAYDEVRDQWYEQAKEERREDYYEELADCKDRRHVFTFFTTKGEAYATLYGCEERNKRVKVYY